MAGSGSGSDRRALTIYYDASDYDLKARIKELRESGPEKYSFANSDSLLAGVLLKERLQALLGKGDK